MPEETRSDRRRFLGNAITTAIAARIGVTSFLPASVIKMSTGRGNVMEQSGRTFASLKHIDAGVLNVAYAEAGPANGPAVVLLHGWPYDIHCYTEVASLLAAKGYRVIVPYVRGFGATRFLSEN